MFRRILAAAAVAVFALVGFSSAASAAPARLAGSDFALVCDLNSSYRARVDMTDVVITEVGAKVDADDIWWRALNHSNGAVSIRVEEVRIELYDSKGSGWITWTTKGGTTTDGTLVAPSVHWDPSAKFKIGDKYTAIRMKAWYGSGGASGSCTSPARTT